MWWFIYLFLFIYLFGVLRRFQHCTGHITTGSWKGRGNQYIKFTRVLYCKLPTNGKQLPAFPLEAVTGIEPRPQRWEVGGEIVTTLPPWTRICGGSFNVKKMYFIYGFTSLSTRVVLCAEETSTYSWSRFCTVNCRPLVSNY